MPESLEAPHAAGTEPGAQEYERPTVRGLVAAHKRLSAAALAVLLVLIGVILLTSLGPRVSRLSDSTSCSVWGSANQAKRDAYAARYVKEHGPLPSGAIDAGTIEGVIDSGCTQAYGFDEADTVTILQALRHQY
jgi:hypothetical protein